MLRGATCSTLSNVLVCWLCVRIPIRRPPPLRPWLTGTTEVKSLQGTSYRLLLPFHWLSHVCTGLCHSEKVVCKRPALSNLPIPALTGTSFSTQRWLSSCGQLIISFSLRATAAWGLCLVSLVTIRGGVQNNLIALHKMIQFKCIRTTPCCCLVSASWDLLDAITTLWRGALCHCSHGDNLDLLFKCTCLQQLSVRYNVIDCIQCLIPTNRDGLWDKGPQTQICKRPKRVYNLAARYKGVIVVPPRPVLCLFVMVTHLSEGLGMFVFLVVSHHLVIIFVVIFFLWLLWHRGSAPHRPMM